MRLIYQLCFALCLAIGPVHAFTPQDADSCISLWKDEVDALVNFKPQIEEAWAIVTTDPERSAEIFVTVRNYGGHSVDFSVCPDWTTLTEDDLSEFGQLRDFTLDQAFCGLSVSTMSIANLEWHSNRDVWRFKTKDLSGNYLISDADMKKTAQNIQSYSQEVLDAPSCSSNDYATDWAKSSNDWARNILKKPIFAD